MTLAQLLIFLVPLLKAVLGLIPATSPQAQYLIAVALDLLGRFGAQHSIAGPHTFAVAAPIKVPDGLLPPESEWTPEGLTKFAEARATDME